MGGESLALARDFVRLTRLEPPGSLDGAIAAEPFPGAMHVAVTDGAGE